jgi:hypothetical protein
MTPLSSPRGGVVDAREGAELGPTPPPTPPPSSPLPPVQPWRATPNAPVPLPRGDRRTPPAPFPSPAPASPSGGLHSTASKDALKRSGDWPAASAVTAAGGGGSFAAPALAVEPRPTTAKRLAPVPLANAPRPRRETARVIVRDGSHVWPVVIALGAAVVVIAAIVHFAVVPLDVLAVWRQPATLTITSDPPGAAVRLDGVALPDATPAHVAVRRDRYEHVLQLTAPGHRAARQTIRYDHAVALATTVHLEREDAPKFEALPTPAAAPTPTSAPAAEPAKAVVAKKVAKPGAKKRPPKHAKATPAKRARVAARH